MGEIGEAMRLFHLERRHLFYDRERETKVLVAWNYHKIMICIRGSSAKANFVADAKVRAGVTHAAGCCYVAVRGHALHPHFQLRLLSRARTHPSAVCRLLFHSEQL